MNWMGGNPTRIQHGRLKNKELIQQHQHFANQRLLLNQNVPNYYPLATGFANLENQQNNGLTNPTFQNQQQTVAFGNTNTGGLAQQQPIFGNNNQQQQQQFNNFNTPNYYQNLQGQNNVQRFVQQDVHYKPYNMHTANPTNSTLPKKKRYNAKFVHDRLMQKVPQDIRRIQLAAKLAQYDAGNQQHHHPNNNSSSQPGAGPHQHFSSANVFPNLISSNPAHFQPQQQQQQQFSGSGLVATSFGNNNTVSTNINNPQHYPQNAGNNNTFGSAFFSGNGAAASTWQSPTFQPVQQHQQQPLQPQYQQQAQFNNQLTTQQQQQQQQQNLQQQNLQQQHQNQQQQFNYTNQLQQPSPYYGPANGGDIASGGLHFQPAPLIDFPPIQLNVNAAPAIGSGQLAPSAPRHGGGGGGHRNTEQHPSTLNLQQQQQHHQTAFFNNSSGFAIGSPPAVDSAQHYQHQQYSLDQIQPLHLTAQQNQQNNNNRNNQRYRQ